ncbi:MAG: hypothetical protein V1790_09740 [Planctomycetota bacterium]
MKRTLIDDFKVPENQIAVATGETREIDDVDLFDRECPVRFIITVQALKERWDCSFAYVRSVAEIGSTRVIEQILGRILRLPRARWKKHAELNCLAGWGAGSSQGRSGGPGPGLHARTDCSAVVSVFHHATGVDSLCPT